MLRLAQGSMGWAGCLLAKHFQALAETFWIR
jgi:hypothetical protein